MSGYLKMGDLIEAESVDGACGEELTPRLEDGSLESAPLMLGFDEKKGATP